MRWRDPARAASCATRRCATPTSPSPRCACSPDLKNATAFVMPLGGGNAAEIVAALQRGAPFCAAGSRAKSQLRHAPSLRFALDTLLRPGRADRRAAARPEVARDLGRPQRLARTDEAAMARKRAAAAPRLARPRQAARHHLEPAVERGAPRCSTPPRPDMRGTLDPLATGVLPIALGEATKTVAFRRWTARKTLSLHAALGRGPRHRRRARARSPANPRRGPSRAAIAAILPALHRHDPAAPAGLFGAQGRRASAPMSWPAPASRRAGAARPVEIAELAARRRARSRPCRFRGRCRQGHLYPRPGPRPRRGARHASAMSPRCAASRSGRFTRSASDFAGFARRRLGIVPPLPGICFRSRPRWTTSRRWP